MSKLRWLANILQQGGLYLLLFLLPFSKAACEISFVLLFIGWLFERIHPASRRESVWFSRDLRPVGIFIGLYLAVCAASILVSTHPELSIRAFFSKWLEYILLFVICTDVVRKPGVLMRGLAILAVSILGVVIEGITQEVFQKGIFRGYPIGPHGLFTKMTGPYENPNDLATYFMVTIPVLAAYAFVLRRWFLRWGTVILLCTALACFVRTEAMGAWVGLWVGLVFMAFLNQRARKPAIALLLAAFLSGLIFLKVTGHWVHVFSPEEGSNIERMAWLQSSIAMLRDRPILGHGLNTFMANYLDYWVGGTRTPVYAHNCYLQVAVETGLVGLAAFAGFLVCFFRRVVRDVFQASSGQLWLLSGLCVGLAAFTVQAALDTNFYSLRQSFLFWALAGMTLGLSRSSSGDHG